MKVRILQKDEYDRWDKFVDESPQGGLFSKSYWLKNVCENDFKLCILENEKEIFAGIALTNFSKNKVKMPILTQSTGILFRKMDGIKNQKKLTNEKEYTNLLFDFILEKLKIVEFNLNFNPNYNYWLPLFWKKFKQTTRYTYMIDYSKTNLEELFKSFSKGHKWTLNKIKKREDIYIFETENFGETYEVLKKTYERQQKKIGYTKEKIEKIYKDLKNRNEIKIFNISNKGDEKIQATIICIYNEKEAYYWLGGSDDEYRNNGVHTYLIWYVINYFSKISKKFNFGGSMIEEVEKNFRNFGGELVPYSNIYWNKYELFFYIKQIVKKMIRR